MGKLLAGQALCTAQKEKIIFEAVKRLGIEDVKIKSVLSKMHRKTEKELHGSYDLLKETLHFFIQNSYSIWKTKNELKKERE